MALATITIGASTVVAPTTLDAFPRGRTTLLVPIDGEAIAQVSNNRDNQGEKNAVREMAWTLLPFTSTDWTHTIQSLKALEGTNTTLNAGTCFGGTYSSNTNIKVINVDPQYIIDNDGTALYSLTISYLHR